MLLQYFALQNDLYVVWLFINGDFHKQVRIGANMCCLIALGFDTALQERGCTILHDFARFCTFKGLVAAGKLSV